MPFLFYRRNNANAFSSDGIVFVNSDGEEEEEEEEDDDDDDEDDEEDMENEQASSSTNSSNRKKFRIMYIQMEFCEKSTLR